MDYLVDTNVLLRALTPANPFRAAARRAVRALLQSRASLCVTPQNLIELWNVCTRPEQYNGLGKSIATTSGYLRLVESFAAILAETPDLFAEWRKVVVTYEVSGAKVHDARLVAAMNIHRVPRILTFNTQDFMRYRNIAAIDPSTI